MSSAKEDIREIVGYLHNRINEGCTEEPDMAEYLSEFMERVFEAHEILESGQGSLFKKVVPQPSDVPPAEPLTDDQLNNIAGFGDF